MLLTFPPTFNTKLLRIEVNNERDLEADLRERIYTSVTSNRNNRTTYVIFKKPYTQLNIKTLKRELNERGFAVSDFVDLSKDKPKKGLKICY